VRSVDEPQQALRLLHVLVRQQAERDRESPLVVGCVLRRHEVAEIRPETVAVVGAPGVLVVGDAAGPVGRRVRRATDQQRAAGVAVALVRVHSSHASRPYFGHDAARSFAVRRLPVDSSIVDGQRDEE